MHSGDNSTMFYIIPIIPAAEVQNKYKKLHLIVLESKYPIKSDPSPSNTLEKSNPTPINNLENNDSPQVIINERSHITK